MPGLIVDPFGGTGTTALLAATLGRHAITADLSADYCRIAAWRTQDPGEIARAMQVDRPPPVSDLQDALFEVTR
jgi:DNA modification methylase